jgi:hypothetical protein
VRVLPQSANSAAESLRGTPSAARSRSYGSSRPDLTVRTPRSSRTSSAMPEPSTIERRRYERLEGPDKLRVLYPIPAGEAGSFEAFMRISIQHHSMSHTRRATCPSETTSAPVRFFLVF